MTKIAVLVKQVPDTNAKIIISGDSVDLSNVKMVMSPYDEFAIENALRHKESVGGTVTAITLGGQSAEKILKDAKAVGVDEIIRIDCDSYLDSNALQSILSSVISQESFDVVYCGKSAADTGAGSTGPGIAERLGWASVSNIIDSIHEGNFSVVAPLNDGNAVIEVPLPAVITCDKGNTKVRKPNVKGIMQAKRAQVDVRSTDIPSSSISIISQSLPPAKPAGKKFEGGQSASEVARLLRDEANII